MTFAGTEGMRYTHFWNDKVLEKKYKENGMSLFAVAAYFGSINSLTKMLTLRKQTEHSHGS